MSFGKTIALGVWPLSGGFVNHGREMGWGDVSRADAIETVQYAFEQGIARFDTADVYGHGRANRLIGEALSGVKRETYAIALKVGYCEQYAQRPYSLENLERQITRSLDDLCTDYVDEFSFHNLNFGPRNEDLEPALAHLETLADQGVVRSLGYRFGHEYTVSPVDTALNEAAVSALATRCDRVHAKLNLLCTDAYVERLRAVAVGRTVMINKPMAQGALWTNFERSTADFPMNDHRRYRKSFQPDRLATLRRRHLDYLKSLELEADDLPAVAIGFLLLQQETSQIAFGAKSPSQVRQLLRTWSRAGELARRSPDLGRLRPVR